MSSDYDAIAARAHVTLGFREITGAPASDAALRAVIGRHPLEDWLQTIGKLSREAARLPSGDPTPDRALAHELGPLSAAALHAIDRGGRFVHPSSLNTCRARQSFTRPQVIRAGGERASCGDLARGLLSVNDLFEDADPEVDPERVVESLLLRRIARPPLQLRNTIPRTYRLFVDLPARFPELSDGFDLDARAQAIAGMSLARYIAITFTFFIRFDQAKVPDEWVLTSSYYPTTSVSADEFERAVRTVSATPAEWRAMYAAESREGRRGADDHRPIVVRPICEIRPGAFIPVDFAVLGERMVGDGVYWRLRPIDDAGKTRYGSTVGKLLEQHLYEVARAVYPDNAEDDRLFRERGYGHGLHGPDRVVVDEDAVMICEVGATGVNVRETLQRGSLEALDHDIREVLIPRAEQLHRKIEDIRAGTLTYPGHQIADKRIQPVVCLLDGFPIAPLLRRRIDSALAAAGLLEQADVGRLSVVSAEEFELACATVELGGRSMTQLLEGHSRHQELASWPLRDFIRKLVGELPMSRLISAEFERAVEAIVQEVGIGS